MATTTRGPLSSPRGRNRGQPHHHGDGRSGGGGGDAHQHSQFDGGESYEESDDYEDEEHETLTMITTALEMDDVAKLTALMRDGVVDVNGVDDDGYSYLILACYYGSYKCVHALLEAGFPTNWLAADGSSALAVAVQASCLSLVVCLWTFCLRGR